jgi:hypothetical protein
MSWWLALIISYLAVSYIAGMGMITLYIVGFHTIKRGGRWGFLKASSPKVLVLRYYIPTMILFWLISPVIAPWWIKVWVSANRGD